jgi:cobalt-zinc-cadmium efflux system membrane fusion protein
MTHLLHLFRHMRFPLLVALTPGVALISCGSKTDQPAAQEQLSLPPSMDAARTDRQEMVRLTPQQASDLKIRTEAVTRKVWVYPITAPGVVMPAPENVAIVSAPVSGRIVAIQAHEGEPVRRGAVVAEMESLEFSTLLADFIQARADAQYQRNQLERIRQLVDKRISPQSALDKTQADFDRADAGFRAALSRLLAVGVTEKEVEGWEASNAVNPRLKVHAPISGSVSEHLIDLGQAVTAYQRMLSIVNLDRVKIEGYVSPDEGTLIRPGDSVLIALKDYPDRRITARVTSINPTLDERNKSIVVYLVIPTRAGWPKPGENLRLSIFVTTPTPVIGVPASAIVYDGSTPMVFLQQDSLTFVRQPLRLLRTASDMAFVHSGIREGDRVAVSQLFTLKALSRMEEYAE